MKDSVTIPPLWYKLGYLALDAAYVREKAFNVRQFSEICNHKVDRHLRGTLNFMVRSGQLKRQNMLHDDGHYRLVYSAKYLRRQQPLPLFGGGS